MEPQEFTSSPPETNFRLKGKKLFLTYPKCPIVPDEILKALKDTIKKELEKYIIVQEFHKDGTPHIHCLLEYTQIFETKNQHLLDIGDYHGNYATVKNYPAAIRYLKKSGVPLSNWDYEKYLKTQVKHGNIATDYSEKNQQAISEGIRSLIDTGAIPLDRYPHWKRGLQEYTNDLNRPVILDNFTLKLPITYRPDTFLEIEIDLTSPIRRHYWFFGTTGTGKTFTAEHQAIRSYVIPKNNDWIGYSGEQLLILNEFKGELFPTQLIDIMEGRQQNIKGSSTALPSNLLLIVTSNYALKDCYKNLKENDDPQLDALERRFTEVLFNKQHPACPQGRDLIVLDATLALEDRTLPTCPKLRRPNPAIEMNQANLCAPAPDLTNHKHFIYTV